MNLSIYCYNCSHYTSCLRGSTRNFFFDNSISRGERSDNLNIHSWEIIKSAEITAIGSRPVEIWNGKEHHYLDMEVLSKPLLHKRPHKGLPVWISLPFEFFCGVWRGGRVRTLQQELAGGKSFKLLQSPWKLLHSTTHHTLEEHTKIRTEMC